MKRPLALGLAFAGLLLISLVIQTPTAIALKLLPAAMVTTTEPAGTLWRGGLGALEAQALEIRTLDWSFQPRGLLGLEAAWLLEARFQGSPLKGRVAVAPPDELRLSGLRYSTGLAPLLARLGATGLGPIQGRVELAIERLRTAPAECRELTGHLILRELNSPLAPWMTPLLPLDAKLACQGQTLQLTLHRRAPAAELEATLRLDLAQRRYRLEGVLTPKSADYEQQLRPLGLERTPSGRLRLDQSGPLPGRL